ncbi:hypothetical protein BN1263220003 [Stenotrophomonas indicatrix]|nr:hypothetical protein BN1263220003 [Stenotrophomonas indicatrix]
MLHAQTARMGAIFHLRHYGQATGLDRHGYAQWVLPLQGELQFEMEGRGAVLTCCREHSWRPAKRTTRWPRVPTVS